MFEMILKKLKLYIYGSPNIFKNLFQRIFVCMYFVTNINLQERLFLFKKAGVTMALPVETMKMVQYKPESRRMGRF